MCINGPHHIQYEDIKKTWNDMVVNKRSELIAKYEKFDWFKMVVQNYTADICTF